MNAKMFFAFVLSAPLFVLSAKAIVYTVRTVSGPVTYSLEVPPGTPVGTSIKPDKQVGYSANFPMTAGSAEVAAVGWAGGLKDKDKSDPYPNSLTILGGKVPGGFYDATYVRPTSVQRINGQVPYYLVQMRGHIAGSVQTFFAAVLDDGNRSPSTSESIRLPPSSPFSGKVGWLRREKEMETACSNFRRSPRPSRDGRCRIEGKMGGSRRETFELA